MKNKEIDLAWIEEVEKIVKSPHFYETITACQKIIEEINGLIPSPHMKFLKLNLTLATDILKVCQKQLFRLTKLRRRGWFT